MLGCLRGRRARTTGFGKHRVDVLVFGRDDAHELPDGSRFAFAHEPLAQHAVAARDELHDGFVGLDLSERLATLHRVALVLQPFDEAPLFHRGRKRLHEDLRRHGLLDYSRYMTCLTAAMVFAASGLANFSRFFAYGMGTSA